MNPKIKEGIVAQYQDNLTRLKVCFWHKADRAHRYLGRILKVVGLRITFARWASVASSAVFSGLRPSNAARRLRLSLCPLGAAGRCHPWQRRLAAKAARLEPLRLSSCTRSVR